MLITRTPLRIPLGGGSTDLPSYYKEHCGFIFAVAINLYSYVTVNFPPMDDKVRITYNNKEIVTHARELKHDIAREALLLHNFTNGIEVMFMGDVPSGSGLGGSNSVAVGLLNALHVLKKQPAFPEILAEESFMITQKLGLPDGKQDPYVAAFGGFVELNIATDGVTTVTHPAIDKDTARRFLENTVLFYTGVHRDSVSLLKEQDRVKVIELKHETLCIGKKVLRAFIDGDLPEFGRLMHEHWNIKKRMSNKMSSGEFDDIYELAVKGGALGGKILGAGGGGFFLFYAEGAKKDAVRNQLRQKGLREIPFRIDYRGSRVVFDAHQSPV